ncbi:uncharacterized protein LOC130759518 isoform X3 [Actinidia eriantha]|uniref:uncharacterized protein LOC130759518 isoform X3 n=1 Tax=Actinidia eriantha TaxID=165200 RepID=UPI002586409B|nr:uncharacterized protein LOC130759518 isoform X3 [Actinidia eriantha]
MSSIKSAASRYNSFDSRSSTQSHHTDPSSSAELKPRRNQFYHASGAIVRAKSSDAAPMKVKNDANLSAMVKKLVAGKPKKAENLVIPTDFIAEDLKKAGQKESNFAGLHRKLFSKGSAKKEGSEKKALTDVKLNTNTTDTRTLAMVLRSERELLSQNKEQEAEIAELKMMLEEKNREVKADKYSVRGCFDADINSPKTPAYDQEDAANSLEFSFEDPITPGSPDDMFLKDLNPCLTPYYAQTKSKEFEAMRYDPPQDERFSGKNMQFCREIGFDSHIKKLSKSSDCCQCSNSGSSSARAARLSVESKYAYGRQINQKLL